jgi:hypothetical protein
MDDEILEHSKRRLNSLKNKLRTWRAVAASLGVNHKYILDFINHGVVPSNKRIRRAMRIPAVLPSERRVIVKKQPPIIGVTPSWEKSFFKRPRKFSISKGVFK